MKLKNAKRFRIYEHAIKWNARTPFDINTFVQNVEICKMEKKLQNCRIKKRSLPTLFSHVQHKFNTKEALCNLP